MPSKLDIIFEVKTLCRKGKTTTWNELLESDTLLPDIDLDDTGLMAKEDGDGCKQSKLGRVLVFMDDGTGNLDPEWTKVLLPTVEGSLRGLGSVALVLRTEGEEGVKPLLRADFELTQEPGGPVKISHSVIDVFAVQDELEELESKE